MPKLDSSRSGLAQKGDRCCPVKAAPDGTGAGIRSFPDAAKGKFMPGPIVRHLISELKWPVALYSFANTPPRSCGSRARNAGGLVNIENRI